MSPIGNGGGGGAGHVIERTNDDGWDVVVTRKARSTRSSKPLKVRRCVDSGAEPKAPSRRRTAKPCIDCPPTGTKRPAPHPGPRCSTHNKAVRDQRRLAAWAKRIWETYRLTAEQYWLIYELQGRCCYICRRAKGSAKRLAVDHRHSDGQVRGLLCTNCNRNVIGKLREDVDALNRAIDYLLDPPAQRVLSNETEMWLPIDGFDGYEVSSLGRVRSWQPYPWNAPFDGASRVLRPLDNGNGYMQVTLVRSRVKFKRSIHGLVARAFIGEPPFEGAEVCHGDNDKANNRVSNLRWDTHSSNQADLVRSGNHNTTRLTEDAVREIRRALGSGAKQAALADQYGVTQTAISSIKLGKTWAWVKEDK